ncbi:MAG TPA: sulfatase-like hydrolase/transferase [Humisphaera sp.]
MLRLPLAFALLLLAPLTSAAARAADAPAAAAAKPPNIVLIISDDQAWTDYGLTGHPHVRTPNIDRLAAEGLTFRRGYVPSSLCCPSLASIVTGLYPHQHKVTSNDPPVPPGVKKTDPAYQKAFDEGRDVMNRHMDAVPTLPRLLSRHGYLTLQTGKWWQGNFAHGGFTHGMTLGKRHGDEGLKIGRQTMQPIYDHIAEARKQGKPFMVWYAPMMPHDPHTPPAALLEKYKAVAPSIHVARYWAMCEWFDQTVGALVSHVDEQGLGKDTVFVFLADNGWIQNPDAPRYAPRSKQSQYDGGIRTPIIVRWTGTVKPRQADELATSLDVAPTLLLAAGLKPTAEMSGLNLLDERAVRGRTTLTGACFTHNAVDLNVPARNLRWRWVIDGDRKLILPDPTNEPAGKPELYDLKADPGEAKNLAGEDAETVRRLTAKLDAWWKPA